MAPTARSTDFLIFAVTAAIVAFAKKASARSSERSGTCSAKDVPAGLLNMAFVFVKPHANTPAVRNMVRDKLTDAGIKITSETDISGKEIDEKQLIDQHYYAIASKATILDAKDIPVPEDKFEKAFGESWKKVLQEDRACNAKEACKRFNCDYAQLDAAWQKSKLEKFGGGFYCGKVALSGKEFYVFNGFFMSMRGKFVGDAASIHCYEVEWVPSKLSWSSFRNELLGPTDPAEAPVGSIRRTILDEYQKLGLSSKPNKGDNGVHASASPLEGLAEKSNWLNKKLTEDRFAKALLDSGLSPSTLEDWFKDPRVNLPEGGVGSIFDALEDMDVTDCFLKMKELISLNEDVI